MILVSTLTMFRWNNSLCLASILSNPIFPRVSMRVSRYESYWSKRVLRTSSYPVNFSGISWLKSSNNSLKNAGRTSVFRTRGWMTRWHCLSDVTALCVRWSYLNTSHSRGTGEEPGSALQRSIRSCHWIFLGVGWQSLEVKSFSYQWFNPTKVIQYFLVESQQVFKTISTNKSVFFFFFFTPDCLVWFLGYVIGIQLVLCFS